MPPSSRKRNKGKERKAKQQAKKEESDRLEAGLFWRRFCIGPYTGQRYTEIMNVTMGVRWYQRIILLLTLWINST